MTQRAKKKQKGNGKLAVTLFSLFAGALIAVGGIGYSSVTVSAREQKIASLESQIRQKKNELDKKKASASAVQVKVKKNVTGLDQEIVDKDKKTAESFFKPAFSWSSGEEYDNARELYTRALGEDSSFLSQFMPENVKVDQYNYVDQMNSNCTFLGMDVYPIAIDGDGYTYLGFVEFSSRSAGLEGEDSGIAAVMFTVDGDRVFDVDAWAVAS